MKIFASFFISVAVFSYAQSLQAQEEPYPLPPVKVVGVDISGDRILCVGSGCWIVLQSMRDAIDAAFRETINPIDGEGGTIDRNKFCKKLDESKPRLCGKRVANVLFQPDLWSVPSSPGISPGWTGNGCGTGGAGDVLVWGALELLFDDIYSIDEPIQGFSFLDACNSHDACFGSLGADFTQCNTDFLNNLRSACRGNAQCSVYASGYHFAVGTDNLGQGAYRTAQSTANCTRWGRQMQLNGCKHDGFLPIAFG